MTGTRLSKDWANARDLNGRGQRLATQRLRRKSSKDGAHYMGVSPDGPFVRGPRSEALQDTPESLSWHEQRVKDIYKSLDHKTIGSVGLEQLQESFQLLGVPLDADMFAKYCGALLNAYATSVSSQQFIDFHKAVWANQPAAVRHRAGCPRAFIGSAAAEAAATDGAAPVERGIGSWDLTASLPSLKDVKDTEGQLRRVFRKYASAASGRLEFQKLPLVLKDLGLDAPKDIGEAESQARALFNVADSDNGGTLSFHELVEFQNRYVASLEALRGGGFVDAFRESAANVRR